MPRLTETERVTNQVAFNEKQLSASCSDVAESDHRCQLKDAPTPMTNAPTGSAVTFRSNAVWITVVIAGISAALHIWKLPAALPLIQEDLGLSLLVAGTLLGIVQVAGMLGGLGISLLAEIIGERRTLVIGLLFLTLGSALGATSSGAGALLVSRAIEGIGFIAASVMGPGLIRRYAPLNRINLAVGCWSAYMGTATFLGLIASAFSYRSAPGKCGGGSWPP